MKKFIFILFLLCFIPSVSLAADIFFSADKDTFELDEDFLVQVFLDTKNLAVNAIEGVVEFPADLLELKEIRDGNSAINFWIEKPHTREDNKVVFSGITAGGFSGPKIFLFGMVFQSKKVGNDSFSFSSIQILQNDGLGTKITTNEIPLTFSIVPISGDGRQKDLKITDTDPPEDFTPFVASDPTIFDGKFFLIFSATDKGVGIDHYEVREGFWSEYERAESPYLLKDQSLGKFISIKAIDKYGNKRLVEIKAQNPNLRLEIGLILGIILVVCILLIKKRRPEFLER